MLKEPLLHFVLLGLAVFVAAAFMNDDAPDRDEIVVSNAQQTRLVAGFAKTWGRPPTAAEYESVLEDWIREEMAYRQGLSMGLDADDAIIRRRIRQKVELLAEEIVSMAPPTVEELEAYLAANAADYQGEDRFSFRQITFSIDERGDDATLDAEQALLLLRGNATDANPERMGDPLPLPLSMEQATPQAIAARFGREFVAALGSLEPGSWQGPVRSGFGVHLVSVDEYLPAEPPTLAAVERDVRRNYSKQQREAAIDRLYAELAKQYTISVEALEAADDA